MKWEDGQPLLIEGHSVDAADVTLYDYAVDDDAVELDEGVWALLKGLLGEVER